MKSTCSTWNFRSVQEGESDVGANPSFVVRVTVLGTAHAKLALVRMSRAHTEALSLHPKFS